MSSNIEDVVAAKGRERKQVIILSGISGSGKSTYANKLFCEFEGAVAIVSADYYFSNSSGEYKFDPALIGEAHGGCFKDYIQTLQETGFSLVIVDNTNLSIEEIAPYVWGAQAYGWEFKIVTIELNPVYLGMMRCVDRNVHGVLAADIVNQWVKLEKRVLPSWWNQETIKFELE